MFLPRESLGWGALWAAVYGVSQSWTRLKRLSSSSSSMCLIGLVVFCEVGIQLTFPHGYQIVQMGWFLCPFSWKCPFCIYTLRSFFKKCQVSRTSDIWKFVQHHRGMFPFLRLLFALHHCLFLVYARTLRGFSVVNCVCFCEDRGCEHRGGAESIVTM